MSLAEELARAQNFTGANGAALATLEGDKLVWLGAVGQNPPRTGDRWALAGSFATLCLGRKTRPQRCDDVEVDGRVDASFRSLHAKSLALAPVHDPSAGKVTGILAVFSDNSRAFNGMHTAVLQTEADSLAELVQVARQAAGIKEEEKKPEAPVPMPLVEASAPPAGSEAAAAPAPLPPTPQQDFEALEAAFVMIPPPATAPPTPPTVESAPPVQATTSAAAPEVARAVEPAPLPKLTIVTPPAPPALAPTASTERPSLPGFTPLSATAAALAKAKPIPPMLPELVVETKAPKPAATPSQPAAAVKKPVTVPTPPPTPAASARPAAPAPVPTPSPKAVMAAPRPPAPKPAEPPAPKFVPLAVKTPPPGSLKPVTPTVAQNADAAGTPPSTKKSGADHLLPAAADPFAGFAPVHYRPPRGSTAAAARPMFSSLDEAEHKEPATSAWKLPAVVALVAAVVLGGLWLRTRSHAATAKPVPAVTQPAPAPAANIAAPAAQPAADATATAAPTSGAAVTVPTAAPASAPAPAAEATKPTPASSNAASTQKPAPEKTAQPSKSQPAPAAAKPSAVATVTAPVDLEVKSPQPVAVPVMTRQQEAPQTMLSVPAAAPAAMPDLPKPAAPAVVRQASTPVAAQLLQSVAPQYPQAARAMHLQGTVRVRAKVSPQGKVSEVTWESGNGIFKQNALDAVKQWRYKPASLDGQPIESTVEVVLKFNPQ